MIELFISFLLQGKFWQPVPWRGGAGARRGASWDYQWLSAAVQTSFSNAVQRPVDNGEFPRFGSL